MILFLTGIIVGGVTGIIAVGLLTPDKYYEGYQDAVRDMKERTGK